MMIEIRPAQTGDLSDLQLFLGAQDLTQGGLDAPGAQLWIARDDAGRIQGSTGYETSGTGDDVLVRSVAVDPTVRGQGVGLRLARHALDCAAAEGARRAWLFSRRSGPFWQRLGFEAADRNVLAERLASTHQVRMFLESGQLQQEVAWSRSLSTGGDGSLA